MRQSQIAANTGLGGDLDERMLKCSIATGKLIGEQHQKPGWLVLMFTGL